jgi:hypothetical protein
MDSLTLREFVARGTPGTHAERERFETNLIESAARLEEAAVARGYPLPTTAYAALEADIEEEFWVITFNFTRRVLGDIGAWP